MPTYNMKCPKCDYEREEFCSWKELQRILEKEPCGACRQNGRGKVLMKQIVTEANGKISAVAAVFTEGKNDDWSEIIALGNLPIFGK